MTEIRFYTNARDRLRAACVITAKAHGQGRQVAVFAPDAALARHFDQLLWSFEALAFIPHAAAGSPIATETPVLIGQDMGDLPFDDVLINLSNDIPAGLERFRTLVEIVSPDGPDTVPARQRFRHYRSAGLTPETTDLNPRKDA